MLNANDINSVKHSYFDWHRPTKFIIHGFLENGFVTWMKVSFYIISSLTKRDTVNVVVFASANFGEMVFLIFREVVIFAIYQFLCL